ncbi:MAG TPA: hypothetical protein VJ902_09530, partial [Wenzhouxiangellaceae bacterium]|nr:hypothetical protein [Wenzhouxiangellaceae bacterium]
MSLPKHLFRSRRLARVGQISVLLAGTLAVFASHTMAQQTSGESVAPVMQCQQPGTIPDRGQIQRSASLPMDIRADDMKAPGNAPMRFSENVRLVYGDQ